MRNILRILLVLSVLMTGTSVYAAIDGTKLLKEIDRNLNPESYEMYRKLINIEPSGRKMEYTFYSIKKGLDKIVGLFLAPASDKGRSTLRLGDNMWLYIPNVGKPIRITSLQSVIGGIFNNADILSLDYSAEYDVEKIEETGNEYLLYLKAKTKTVAYDRLKLWADKNKKLPTKIECLTEAVCLSRPSILRISRISRVGLSDLRSLRRTALFIRAINRSCSLPVSNRETLRTKSLLSLICPRWIP